MNKLIKSSFSDRELLSFRLAPEGQTGKLKKKTLSLLWKISLSFDDIWNTKPRREGETKSLVKEDFSGEALSKQNIKA